MATTPTTGTLVWLAVKPILKLALPAGAGFALTRSGLFTVAGSRSASQIILNVTLPALLFSKIVPSFTPQNISAIGPIVLTATVYMLLSGVFALIIRSVFPVPRNFRYGLIASACWSNWGDLPTSVVQTITLSPPFNGVQDSDLGVAYVAVYILVFYVTMFPLRGTWFIERDYKDAPIESDEESAALTSPVAVNALKTSIHRLSSVMRKRKGHARDDSGVVAEADGAKSEGAAAQPSSLTGGQEIRRVSTSRSIGQASVQEYAAAAHAASFEHVNDHNKRSLVRKAHRAWLAEKNRLSTIGGSRAPSISESEDRTAAGGEDETELQTLPTLKAVPETLPESPPTKSWLQHVGDFARPFFTPPTITLGIALVCALVNPLKSLFVADTPGDFHPTAPDGQPALAIIIETASFLGGASVPLGLLVLGSALARLTLPRPLTKLPLASIAALALAKLVLLPVIGYFLVDALVRHGLVDKDNNVLRFVLIYFSAVPTATTQLALTQIYAPEGESNSDTLSAYLVVQYVVFLFSSVVLTALTLRTIHT